VAAVVLALGALGLRPVPALGAPADPTTTAAVTTTSPPAPTTTAGPATTTTLPGATTTAPGGSTTTTSTVPGEIAPPGTVDQSKIDQLSQLNDQYEDASADEIDLFHRYLAVQQQATDLAKQVGDLNTSLATAQGALTTAEATLAGAQQHQADTDARRRDAGTQLDRERARLRAQAVAAYMGGNGDDGTSGIDAVLHAGTLDDAGKTLVYASAVVDDERATVARVSDLHDEVDRLSQTAADDARAAAATRDDVARQEAAVADQRNQAVDLQQQVEAQNATQQQLLAEVSAKRAEVTAQIAENNRVSDGISSTLAGLEKGETLPLQLAGIFLSPIPDPKFNSPFGARVDPILGTVSVHEGVDIAGTTGTPIRAPADGVVVIAGEVSGYGNCTVIDHGNGLGTLYGHQSQFAVKVGDRVTRGQIIGYVGSTGHSTGPHLHWEVREFGQPTDPVPFIGPG
jgi:murein DD-endopeptidase MepM/ murein hydrolase activator NlpD